MSAISVIIPTLGRMFWVDQLISSLLHGTRTPDEIVVVDQTPETERSPIAYQEMQRLIETRRIKYLFTAMPGLTHARNVGARAATAGVLVFLDDDVFVPGYFLEEYERIFWDPSTSAATGMILVHSKDDGTFKPLVAQESLPWMSNMLRGGNFAVRREAFLRIGGMDERFVRACQHEDWDLAWRVHAAGLKAIWSPGPWCYHAAVGDGGGRWRFFRGLEDRAYNVIYFHLRHPAALGSKSSLHKHILRQFVLNKEGFQRPWILPKAAWTAARAFRRAAAALHAGPILPFDGPARSAAADPGV